MCQINDGDKLCGEGNVSVVGNVYTSNGDMIIVTWSTDDTLGTQRGGFTMVVEFIPEQKESKWKSIIKAVYTMNQS